MPRVLVFSYYWPPAGGPASIRIVKFVKYLAQLDWQASVITVRKGEFPYRDPNLAAELPSTCRVYPTRHPDPFSLYRCFTGKKKQETLPTGIITQSKTSKKERLSAWIRAQFFVPDARIGWVPFALVKARQIIKKEKIDIIFISSPPHSIQLLVPLLKLFTRIPCIIDLRDPWTDIRYYKAVKRSTAIKLLDRFFERRILISADHVITVSSGLADQFRHLARRNINISVIPNGYDPDDFAGTDFSSSSNFIMLYSGNLLENQNPHVLWQALIKITQKTPKFALQCKLVFIGNVPQEVKNILQDLPVKHELKKFMPHRDVIQQFINARILIVVIPKVENNKGIVTSKLYEYAGSGNPILAIGPETGDAAGTIGELPDSCMCDYNNVGKCENFILDVFKKWNRGVPSAPSPATAKFSRPELTKHLVEIFNMYR
ncbi:glycosyltransferase [candidate division KSB1 bacterium]|nr:glycosyltransferase [candidate division KSB1 bacterium]